MSYCHNESVVLCIGESPGYLSVPANNRGEVLKGPRRGAEGAEPHCFSELTDTRTFWEVLEHAASSMLLLLTPCFRMSNFPESDICK